MSGLLSSLDSGLFNIGSTFEHIFRSCKNAPQYKYLTVPIYKACVEKMGPVAATALSFLSADLIVHQLLPQAVNCLSSAAFDSKTANDSCTLSYSYGKTLYWAAMAVPIMYVKYIKSRSRNKQTEAIQNATERSGTASEPVSVRKTLLISASRLKSSFFLC
jgi:hypothetical protein